MNQTPLIAHVIHHFIIGGIENGLVNLINRIPENQFRHTIICMKNYSDFKDRIQRDDVDVIAINKKEGNDFSAQWRLYQLFRKIKPDITHTRNLGALDALIPAAFAGVKHRIHGEHGRDENDVAGNNKKLQLLRRLHRPLIKHYVPLSQDLENYLHTKIGVPEQRMTQIYNGVDTDKFVPAKGELKALISTKLALNNETILIGTVGRIQPVKDQMNLARAFVELLRHAPDLRNIARLVLIGDGPLREKIMAYLKFEKVDNLVWCSGERNDIHQLLQNLDVFVLPSLAEGISNTILEAMASGLPVVATDVGGNAELVNNGATGFIVPSQAPVQMAQKLEIYLRDAQLRKQHGMMARQRAVEQFSLNIMVENYIELYQKVLAGKYQ